jgi:hypothetical protein
MCQQDMNVGWHRADNRPAMHSIKLQRHMLCTQQVGEPRLGCMCKHGGYNVACMQKELGTFVQRYQNINGVSPRSQHPGVLPSPAAGA